MSSEQQTAAEAEVIIYSHGLVNLSVCALNTVSVEEIAKVVNLSHPTGVGPWVLAAEGKWASGEPMPSPCNGNPDTRTHYLFHC